jgi:hypothetical protein
LGYNRFWFDFGSYSRRDPSSQRKGAKDAKNAKEIVFCLALRPLQLGAFALEADIGVDLSSY